MSESKDIETSRGGTLQNSAPSGSPVNFAPQPVVPDVELSYSDIRQKMLTLSEMLDVTISKARQLATVYSGDEALLAIPQRMRDMEWGPEVCQTRFVLPGAIDDEEWVPAVVSTPAAALDEEERSLTAALDEEERSIPGKMSLLYEVGRQIGRGAFSKVDEGTCKSDGMKSGKEIFTKISSNPRTLRQTDPVPAAVEVNTPLIYWASFNVMPSRCLTNDHRRNLLNLLIRLHISPKGFFPPRTFFPPCKKIREVFLLGGFFNPGRHWLNIAI
ncbi:uncharacterized protein [Misgurnus anguillicaudatus]|uniref:uncharacterized protein isoform X2 n=1 Tax=Misgurnus anguillicaudatus TaxID=75329 RepID=UPI003CCFA6D7